MKRLVFLVLCFLVSPATAVDLGAGRPGDPLYIHHAPDPVNPRNGNFYLPLPYYYQSCFGFPLEIYLSYNSFSSRIGPFGRGWTFNYDVKIAVGEEGNLQIVEPDGFLNEYVPVEELNQNKTTLIKKIVAAKKREDIRYMKNKVGKGPAHYKEIENRLKTDSGYFSRQRQRYLGKQSQSSKSGKYVSFSRGTTYLTKTPTGYRRTTEIGHIEDYNKNGQLTKITDRMRNQLRFIYDSRSRLSRAVDGCGNFLVFSYDTNGKVVKVKDSFSRELFFAYNKDLLTLTKGIDKNEIIYTYDKFNRMNSVFFKDDRSKTTISYDSKGRVTKQSGPGTKVTTFTYAKKDGIVSTRVKDNKGENTLYEYNDAKNEITQTDAKGVKTKTVLSECCGKPTLIETSTGIKDTFSYDAKGNLITKVDTKGRKTVFDYEPRFSHVSEIVSHNGETLRYRYDQHGNLSFAKKIPPKGSGSRSPFVKISRETHGKIDSIIDDQGREIKFAYSKIGKTKSIQLWKKNRRTASIEVDYEDNGEMKNLRYIPDRPEIANMIKNTLNGYLGLIGPAGIDFEIK